MWSGVDLTASLTSLLLGVAVPGAMLIYMQRRPGT
jgi:hypothetical protein